MDNETLALVNGIIQTYLDSEEAIEKTSKDTIKTIYNDSHPLYNLLSFLYPNLYLPERREAYERVASEERRTQYITRLRLKAFEVASIIGIEAVKKIIRSQIDYLVLASGVTGFMKARVLRRELELFYLNNSTVWFSALVVPYYSIKFIANSVAQPTSQTARKKP